MGLPFLVSSRQGRSFGPSRGKMGARLGARSHSVVVEDVRSTNKTRLVRDEGPPHAQSERANQSDRIAARRERTPSSEQQLEEREAA